MKTLRLSSRGQEVRNLQALLKITQDGIFGPQTLRAVLNFQRANKLNPDGIVGPLTWRALLSSSNANSSPSLHSQTNQLFETYHLPKEVYFNNTPVGEQRQTKKRWIFLHHTRGWENPYRVIDGWAATPLRKVATEFVIGGQNIENTPSAHDGRIVQALPTGTWAWHLGIGNNAMHRESIGIELCSFGELTKGLIVKNENGRKRIVNLDPSRIYTFTGRVVHPQQVSQLNETFRNFDYYHRYSERQIQALKQLLHFIAQRDNIDIRAGLPELIRRDGAKAFDKLDRQMCNNRPGIWSHTNLISYKLDTHPQPELIQMLTEL
jgi:N-acetyl-anhydromuramyl-L-alanine amidase AmpD